MATSPLFSSASSYAFVEELLRDVAHQIQLSPTDYRLAVDHYEAVCDWLRREDSPLSKYFGRLYPQGSMAIGATIASRLKNDEFDIDVVLQLNIDADNDPARVLDVLFETMNGEKGSRYHGKITRRSRCVTVEYDRMHLDITPAVLLPERQERTSVIFHANENEPPSQHKHIVANPWGFANWFSVSTPNVRAIVEAAIRKSADPVPVQDDLFDKSSPLMALQLLKRWRNKCYDGREGRSPPSIMLAYFVAMNAVAGRSLFEEIQAQAYSLLKAFAAADASQQLIHVENPTCATDILSDRWPGSQPYQNIFTNDLRRLVANLESIEADSSLENCAKVFEELFGENPTRIVVEDFKKRYAEKAQAGALFATSGRSAGLALGASGLAAISAKSHAVPIKRHTDFGSDE
jgi:Second Messenger Oligonucleotide or Dinucleotide Synthetase domain